MKFHVIALSAVIQAAARLQAGHEINRREECLCDVHVG